jgi:sec-independent protein translocase protein TatA
MFEGLFQPMHLLLLLGIALLFFGPSRLPELGKGLGSSIRGFREALNGAKDEKQQIDSPKETAPAEKKDTPT